MAPADSEAYTAFLGAYPDYGGTAGLDELRAREYARLDRLGQLYLDYTGAGLHADSQVRDHAALLGDHLCGNPHSASPASQETTRLVEQTRQTVLAWFKASPEVYTAVFTTNATGAIKHVAESFPFRPGGRLLLTADNHNSVNGIREFARAAGATVDYAPLTVPTLRLEPRRLDDCLDAAGTDALPRLFAYPAQSNFSGVKHSLEYVERARSRGWTVLLDAAAFVPTNELDLERVQPDFVCVSFYKMFGYPTGVGCLIARREALARLERPWFAGGTVNFASVQGQRHILAAQEAGFEDGTLNFLSIPAVDIGLRLLASVGMSSIQTRVRCLTGWLLEALLTLRHGNGRPVVRIYGPADTTMRGGTITLNCYDPDGHLLDYRRIEELAAAEGISLRTGCFCNPGSGETAEGLTEEDMRLAAESDDMTLPRFRQLVAYRGGKSAGAIRVSLGLVSNFADVHRFVRFLAGLRDQTQMTIGEVTFDIETCRVLRDGA